VSNPGPYIQAIGVLVNASDPKRFGIPLLEATASGVAVTAVNSGRARRVHRAWSHRRARALQRAERARACPGAATAARCASASRRLSRRSSRGRGS